MPKRIKASFWVLEQVAIDRRLYPRNLGLTEEEYKLFLLQRSCLNKFARQCCGNNAVNKYLKSKNYYKTSCVLEENNFIKEEEIKGTYTFYKSFVLPFYSKGKYKSYQRMDRNNKNIMPTVKSLGSCGKGFIMLPTQGGFKCLLGELSGEELDVLFSFYSNLSYTKWNGVNPNFIYIEKKRKKPYRCFISNAMQTLLNLDNDAINKITNKLLDKGIIIKRCALLHKRQSKSYGKYGKKNHWDVLKSFNSQSLALTHNKSENENFAFIIQPKYFIKNSDYCLAGRLNNN